MASLLPHRLRRCRKNKKFSTFNEMRSLPSLHVLPVYYAKIKMQISKNGEILETALNRLLRIE